LVIFEVLLDSVLWSFRSEVFLDTRFVILCWAWTLCADSVQLLFTWSLGRGLARGRCLLLPGISDGRDGDRGRDTGTRRMLMGPSLRYG